MTRRSTAPAQRNATAKPAAPATRANGSTAGVTRQAGQAVFSSSTAPVTATQKSTATKSAARSSAKSTAPANTTPAPSTRSATGDLWSGVASAGAKPSLTSAAAAGGENGGLSGAIVAGIVLLGLGLVGITGGALVTAGRRRRAAGVSGAAKQR